MKKTCFECGELATEDHHVIPESFGGTKTVPLCGRCHNLVHDGNWNRRDNHSELTRQGIQRAKDKGIKLGNNTNLKTAREYGRQNLLSNVNDFAESLRTRLLHELCLGKTMAQIAETFNDDNILSYRGGIWHCGTISKLLDRCKIPKGKSVDFYKNLLTENDSSYKILT